MPNAITIALIPLLPLAGFVILGLFGRKYFKKSSGIIGTGLLLASAILALYTAYEYFFVYGKVDGIYQKLVPLQFTWLEFSPGVSIDMGLLIDPISVMMLVVVTFIFELQVMSRFGAQLDFGQCVFCHRKDLPMDFSYKFNGCLCRNHFDEDMKRSHVDPNVIFLCQSFMAMDLEKLPSINLSDDLKKKIRVFIDALYDHYIGVQIKAKKFIDGLDGWADIIK